MSTHTRSFCPSEGVPNLRLPHDSSPRPVPLAEGVSPACVSPVVGADTGHRLSLGPPPAADASASRGVPRVRAECMMAERRTRASTRVCVCERREEAFARTNFR